jgi:hypothetical protein
VPGAWFVLQHGEHQKVAPAAIWKPLSFSMVNPDAPRRDPCNRQYITVTIYITELVDDEVKNNNGKLMYI